MRTASIALSLLLLGSLAEAQDQAKIDAAIRKGLDYLKGADSPPHPHSKAANSDELILYTFVVADVAPTNARFKTLLESVLTDEPHQTYKVALQAMALEELDRVKYQNRIAYCGQHLIDNECANGQWSYGSPTVAPKDVPTGVSSDDKPEKPKPVTGTRDFGGTEKVKPKVVRKIPIKKQKDGPATGDNSNTQYASLGLRACFDAGILIPEESIQLAVRWLIESMHAGDGPDDKAGKGAVVSGGETPAKPQGWGYKGAEEGKAYGSMTAGAVGAITIYDYMLKKDWKKDQYARNGLAWLGKNFSATSNPGRGTAWELYYLYGIERAGVLYGTDKIGDHDWYLEGAKQLLGTQGDDGSWKVSGGEHPTWDTCFAILFLKKATKPLVASTDRR
ncbi:MAG TPA: hypothetical protein VKW04_07000 [Planctomycetota bacterium]|nr:hypothetical protein [Planctomycetota bacterium]